MADSKPERYQSFDTYQYFVSLLSKTPASKPNDLGIMFAIANYIMTRYCGCQMVSGIKLDQLSSMILGNGYFFSERDEDLENKWPFESTYRSNIRKYKYYDHCLEMSMLVGKDSYERDEYFYLVLSFPHKPDFYVVEEISCSRLPKFTLSSKYEDEKLIDGLSDTITDIFRNFCRLVVDDGKEYKSNEYSMEGVAPLFSNQASGSYDQTKKRRMNYFPYPNNIVKLDSHFPPFYERLRDMYNSMDPKPGSVSRLFAFVHDLFVSKGYSTTLRHDEWPGGCKYKNQAVEMGIGRCLNLELTGANQAVLNFSILKNDRQYFLCLRFVSEPTSSCIRRISGHLVPTFQSSDAQREKEKIANLHLWSHTITVKYVQNVLEGLAASSSFINIPSPSETPSNK